MPLSSIARRAFGALRLDPSTYEEIEHDTGATWQALAIVLLSGAGIAIGRLASFRPGALLAGMLVAVIGWGVWAGLCWVIGTRLLPEPQTEADAGQLLRVLGFAAAPGMAEAMGAITLFRAPILVMAQVWMILAMVVAVRQALDYRSTTRALAVCLIGWIVQSGAMLLLIAMMRPAFLPRAPDARAPAGAVPTAGYVGVVKPSGVTPPVD